MEQHLEALERANEVRLARAELKRAVNRGEIAVTDLLVDDLPDWLEGMRAEELLRAQRYFQSKIARRLIEKAGASLLITVGKLTRRQRRLIANELEAIKSHREMKRRYIV